MTFHETMLQDHAAIDGLLRELLQDAEAGDRETLAECWDRFEPAILAHMDAEEMFMLPGLRRHDARRAQAILDEHREIRELLATIDLGLDLHIVRDEQLGDLAHKVGEHARREEVDFYRWADEALSPSLLRSIRKRLQASVTNERWPDRAGVTRIEARPRG